MTDPRLRTATRIIHNRRHVDAFGSPASPTYSTTTYRFDKTADLLDVIERRKAGYLYTRWGTNPTIQELEQGLATLEDAEAALAFSAGMAAISAAFLALGRSGILCVGELYGGTQELLTRHCQPLGIPVTFVPRNKPDQLAAGLTTPGMLVFCETPANPTLALTDLQQLAAQVHDRQGLLMVDNTFATPINQQPLRLGADLVVHSATKYLGGHSDLTAGAVMTSAALADAIAPWRTSLGQLIAPETANLLARSLKSLPVRVQQHNHNALKIAAALEDHPAIRRVLYPGLASFPQHGLAQRQMSGFGGMVTIEIAGGRDAAANVADNLQLFLLATSLGGVESLVSQPCATSHHGISRQERERQGITDGMLRLSVGLEDADNLVDDLLQALSVL